MHLPCCYRAQNSSTTARRINDTNHRPVADVYGEMEMKETLCRSMHADTSECTVYCTRIGVEMRQPQKLQSHLVLLLFIKYSNNL